MHILSLTAGAAAMYCGSCLRDNTLAAELKARGHDIVLLPLYTPTRTDEPNVSYPRVFFGGISVYLQQYVPLFRWTPNVLDRVWDSMWALKLAARRSIQTDPQMLRELTVSMLRGTEGFQRKEMEKLIAWLKTEPRPDVISIPHGLLIGLARPLKEALSVPVTCTLQGENLFLDGLGATHRERALGLMRDNVPYVDAFIAVSEFYADLMIQWLNIPPSKMHVVPLGITLKGFEDVPVSRDDTFTVGFFARIAPEKGLHVLCEAYARLRRDGLLPRARLVAAGYLGADHEPYLARIRTQMRDWGLAGEFTYRGALDRDEKIAFLRSLDVMSVPVTYDEPKGLSVIEAMAAGVPVVQPSRGAFPEMLRVAPGGLLVDPVDDVRAVAEGILSLYRDPDTRQALGRRGAEGVRAHYTVAHEADRFVSVCTQVMEPGQLRRFASR